MHHIFVTFSPWIHINISWNCLSKWLFLLSLFTFWPPSELSVHFQHIMLDMQDIWSVCGQKKRSKTCQMNSKRLSSVSYHDVKLKQFIKALKQQKRTGFNAGFWLPAILLYLWVENKPLWCWVSIKFIGYRNLLRPEKTAEISFGYMNGWGLISLLQSDLNVLFSPTSNVCERSQSLHQQDMENWLIPFPACFYSASSLWEYGCAKWSTSHSCDAFQSREWNNRGIPKSSMNWDRISAKFFLYPSVKQHTITPTLDPQKTQRVEEKQPPRLRGRPSQETKEKTGSMRKWRTHKILVLFFWLMTELLIYICNEVSMISMIIL